MRVADLQAELESRGLETAGVKSVLVKRLTEEVEREDLGLSAASQAPPSVSAVSGLADEVSVTTAAANPQPDTNGEVSQNCALIREEVRAAITDGIGACLLQPAPTPTSAELTPSLQLQLDDPAQNSLPPNLHVPRAVQERVSRGEFIDFDQFLPEVLGAHDPSARKPLEFRSNAGGALELVEVGASRPVLRRVHDIGTWLEAWTMYMHAICTIAPHRMSELLSYQAMILAANRQYYSDAWLSYDQQFRMQIASQPGRRFDSIDINTWQLCVTGKARPRCSSCNIVHPASTNCPFRPKQSNQGTPSGLLTRNSTGKFICRNFNFGKCSHQSCRFAHSCNRCGKDHPRVKCSANT